MEGSVEALSLFQYWHSGKMPDDVAALTETFAAHNPELRHRIFDEAAAADLIATHFGPRERDCFAACAMPVMQADYFRYCALLACGGVYADVDYCCKRSLAPLIEDESVAVLRAEPQANFAGRDIVPIQNSFLLFKRPRHPLLELTLEMATSRIEQTRTRVDLGRIAPILITGPAILTVLHLAYRLGSLEALAGFFAGTDLENLSRRALDAIDDHRQVVDAFDGVRLVGVEEFELYGEGEIKLPYKSTGTHWSNFASPVYRATA
ncbi:MAG TPA: glycosyltransferase [Solirubrobacterales bacterium]|nr:glycosyltransferase [Solirubrobacterales bacterium]